MVWEMGRGTGLLLLIAILLNGCTAQEAADFNQGAAEFRAGTSAWPQPAQPQTFYVTGPSGYTKTCQAIGQYVYCN